MDAKKVLCACDYLGRRVKKAVLVWDDEAWDDTHADAFERRFVWAGWLMLLELDESNDAVRSCTWGLDLSRSLEGAGGIGGLLAVHDADGAEDYVYTYDANGNVGQLVAWAYDYGSASEYGWHADRLVAHYEYDPYGNIVNDTSGYGYAEDNPFRFSTKYWDDETGLGYWGYRYYDPRTGRWISRDPIGELGSVVLRYVAARGFIARDPLDDQSNLYRYVHNAPVTQIDAYGLTSDAVWTKCKKDCASEHGLNPDDWKGQQDAYDRDPEYNACVNDCVKQYPDPAGACDGGAGAVECWVDYSRLSITCHLGDAWVSCKIVCPEQKDYEKYGGPTPPGTYGIAKKRIHPERGCGWYNLCPFDRSGGYRSYKRGHPEYPRSHMGLHPGTASLGCVTVDEECWSGLSALVEQGRLKCLQLRGHGHLVVTNAVPE
ncbi:MAG: RHS repeat-associated core domain-containing protein [Planctomycetota bacterium]